MQPENDPLRNTTNTTDVNRTFDGNKKTYNLKQVHINWYRVAISGASSVLITAIAVSMLMGLGLLALIVIGTIFGGVENAILFIVLIGSFVGGKILDQNTSISAPYVTSALSYFILSSLYYVYLKFIPSTFYSYLSGDEIGTVNSLLSNPIIAIGSLLGLAALTFVVIGYLLEKPRINIVLIPLVIGISCFAIFIASNHKNIGEERLNRKVRDLDWAVSPHYLPPGVSFSGNDYEDSCLDADAEKYSYTCSYVFEEYPGYLTKKSQERFDAERKYSTSQGQGTFQEAQYAPKPIFDVLVVNDRTILEQYLYSENRCDIAGLKSVGVAHPNFIEEIAEQNPASSNACEQHMTDQGITLYSQNVDMNFKGRLKTPVSYYFTKGEAIIIISIGNMPYIKANLIQSIYIVDDNFISELHKFVDGFQQV